MGDKDVLLNAFNKVIGNSDESECRIDDDKIERFIAKLIFVESITLQNIKDIFSLSYDIGVYRNRSVRDDIEDILYGATKLIVSGELSPQDVIEDLEKKSRAVFAEDYWSNGVCFKCIGIDYS